MLTNKHVVLSHNYPLEHHSSVLRDTRAENQDIKVWPSQQPGFLGLLGAMYVGICKDGKVFSKECVEG